MWHIPDSFPDLSAAKTIAVDIETFDPELKTKGPGVRRNGHIIGIAIGTDDGFRAYYPIAHQEGPNLNKRAVLKWLKKELSRERQSKLGANLLYDADYLAHQGIVLAGKWIDVQIAEPLIDENAGSYALDVLATKYLGRKKETSLIEQECAKRKLKGKPQQYLYKFPAHIVGPYAEADVDLPFAIFEKQKRILAEENLEELFAMESELTPLLLQMRRTGVRLDTSKLDATITQFERRLKALEKELKRVAGREINYWQSEDIARACDLLGVRYPRTAKKQAPSFTKEWFRLQTDPFSTAVHECRELDKFINTFLKGQMHDYIIDGRVHCLFNQLRSDEYGTVTGRFSSSSPNLQFMPARDEELGPLCRSMFIPEEDHAWGKLDYSQVEYRIFSHYATGRGADALRRRYNEDHSLDMHQWCADEAGVDRKRAKTINFGKIYGMGVDGCAQQLGMTREEAYRVLGDYDAALPFVKETMKKVTDVASARGYIKTILGRRRRFTEWEPKDRTAAAVVGRTFSSRKEAFEALNRLGLSATGVKLAYTYRALNALVQGSAADLLKKAMRDAFKAGIFDTLPLHLTVHDELDISKPKNKAGDEAWKELQYTMEHAIQFRVPILVEAKLGNNWGMS